MIGLKISRLLKRRKRKEIRESESGEVDDINTNQSGEIREMYYLNEGYGFHPALVDPLLVEPMAYPYMDLASLEDYVNDTTLGADFKPRLDEHRPRYEEYKHHADDSNSNSNSNPWGPLPSQGSSYPCFGMLSHPFERRPSSHMCPEPTCRREFKRPEHLKRHIQSIHIQTKPFRCHLPNCDRSFSRSDNLAQHLKIHLNKNSDSF